MSPQSGLLQGAVGELEGVIHAEGVIEFQVRTRMLQDRDSQAVQPLQFRFRFDVDLFEKYAFPLEQRSGLFAEVASGPCIEHQ